MAASTSGAAEHGTPASQSLSHGPSWIWTLAIAIPFDIAGLYLTLAAVHLLPKAWPVPAMSDGVIIVVAVLLFAVARVLVVIGVRRVVRWRDTSAAWRRLTTAHRRELR